MGKFKELWNGPDRSFFRYATVITVPFLLYIVFLGSNSLVRWAGAAVEIKRQERQMIRLRREINRMDLNVSTLSTNKDSLERYARERFGFAAPDEDVYELR